MCMHLNFLNALLVTSDTLVALRGAASAQNISFHLSKPGSGMHITSSVRDIHNSSMLRQNRYGDQVVVTAAGSTAVTRLNRFSASTGHLLKNAKTGNEDANFLKGLTSDDSKLEVDNGKAISLQDY